MKKLKLVMTIALSILLVVVIFQNTEPVETKVLFISISMPRAILLFCTAAVGFVLGVVWTMGQSRN